MKEKDQQLLQFKPRPKVAIPPPQPSQWTLHLAGSGEGLPTLEDLIDFTTRLTGRAPTEAEIEEVKEKMAEWDRLDNLERPSS
ncbi:MAG: hypothetical protein ABI689_16715 [Thermoanaerobaculia bacterium]